VLLLGSARGTCGKVRAVLKGFGVIDGKFGHVGIVNVEFTGIAKASAEILAVGFVSVGTSAVGDGVLEGCPGKKRMPWARMQPCEIISSLESCGDSDKEKQPIKQRVACRCLIKRNAVEAAA
jgi:hypothetical protein